jgi:hypothetical protein
MHGPPCHSVHTCCLSIWQAAAAAIFLLVTNGVASKLGNLEEKSCEQNYLHARVFPYSSAVSHSYQG